MPKLDPRSTKLLGDRIAHIVNNMILHQRRITGYDGPDKQFAFFVAENPWDWEFQATIFNSGYLRALLDMAELLQVKLPKELMEKAKYHINEAPPEWPFTEGLL